MKALTRHAQGLQSLASRGRLRRLAPRAGLDFASNDYLGLAGSDVLKRAAFEALERGVPVGSGGSRLLRGNHPEHEALEAEAAAFFGCEATLYMGGGFQGNVALFSTLPAAGDLVLYDELVHASAHDGMRLGRADLVTFAHNNAADARMKLAEWQAAGGDGQVWIAVESVYSMEGDIAPLTDFAAVARDAGAILVVDEAHATGVFGAAGQGFAHGFDGVEVLTLHTCGKGLGVSGALICGARVLIDALVNRARPFIFATAPSPFDAALVRAAIGALQNQPQYKEAAEARIAHAHEQAARLCGLNDLQSQIIPVIIGADKPTMARGEALQQAGFDVRGIRPPTVPRNTSRLRVSITGNVTHAEITSLFEHIARQQETA